MSGTTTHHFVVLGAGVVGLSTALELRDAFPRAEIVVVAKHFPGDRSVEYASPWAGANWCSMATDNGALEGYDRVTFERFGGMLEAGLGREVRSMRFFYLLFFWNKKTDLQSIDVRKKCILIVFADWPGPHAAPNDFRRGDRGVWDLERGDGEGVVRGVGGRDAGPREGGDSEGRCVWAGV